MKQEKLEKMRYKASKIHHELCKMHSVVYKNKEKNNQEDSLLFDIMSTTTTSVYTLCMALSKMLK